MTLPILVQKFKNQSGFALTSELILIVTILVIGGIVGMVTVRDSVTAEMHDVAEAIGELDQSYDFDGILNSQTTAIIAGSSWSDAADTNAGDDRGWGFVTAGVEGNNSGTNTSPDGNGVGGTVDPTL